MRSSTLSPFALAVALCLPAAPARGQDRTGVAAMRRPNVEFDMVTWQEVKAAPRGGRTTGRETVRAIALELGDAITAETFAAVNGEAAERRIISGFRNVVLVGDHGGGQDQLRETAATLDAKHRAEGVRVVYCDEVYAKANGDFEAWLRCST